MNKPLKILITIIVIMIVYFVAYEINYFLSRPDYSGLESSGNDNYRVEKI